VGARCDEQASGARRAQHKKFKHVVSGYRWSAGRRRAGDGHTSPNALRIDEVSARCWQCPRCRLPRPPSTPPAFVRHCNLPAHASAGHPFLSLRNAVTTSSGVQYTRPCAVWRSSRTSHAIRVARQARRRPMSRRGRRGEPKWVGAGV
jgi:hypothetical protein